jgi:hypothetical protein
MAGNDQLGEDARVVDDGPLASIRMVSKENASVSSRSAAK